MNGELTEDEKCTPKMRRLSESKNSKINGDSPQQCDEKCYENCYIFRRGKCDPEKDECLGQELIDWYQETGR